MVFKFPVRTIIFNKSPALAHSSSPPGISKLDRSQAVTRSIITKPEVPQTFHLRSIDSSQSAPLNRSYVTLIQLSTISRCSCPQQS